MCCSTAAFTQIKYDVVNTHAVQHHFVGYNRHTVKKIFELQRSLITIQDLCLDRNCNGSCRHYNGALLGDLA